MSTETQQFKTLMAQMGLLAEIGRNYDRAYREVIGRFEALKKERDAAVARAEQAEQARDAAEATIATLRGGRGEGAQRSVDRTVEEMLERLRLVWGDSQEAKSLREEIIARCDKLRHQRDAEGASNVTLQMEKSVVAQRAAHLADEVQRLTQERDEAVAALAAERAATETSTAALRAELDALIAEIDKVRRERTDVISENIRTANVVVDLRARIRELNEANLLLKQQLRAQEAVAQQATAVASTPAPADDDLDSTAWQRVARDLGDELLRARHIIAAQAARLEAATKRPAGPTPSTQDSP